MAFGTKIPFRINTLNVQGALRCGRTLFKTNTREGHLPLPLVPFWVCFSSRLGLTSRLIQRDRWQKLKLIQVLQSTGNPSI
jgi:hypothetical protein